MKRKSVYANLPSSEIIRLFDRLNRFGSAVVAVRTAEAVASANLLGHVYIGEDAGDRVLRVEESDAHVHVKWDEISGFATKEEDTPAGLEPVVWLVDGHGMPVIRIFFPQKIFAELVAALA